MRARKALRARRFSVFQLFFVGFATDSSVTLPPSFLSAFRDFFRPLFGGFINQSKIYKGRFF